MTKRLAAIAFIALSVVFLVRPSLKPRSQQGAQSTNTLNSSLIDFNLRPQLNTRSRASVATSGTDAPPSDEFLDVACHLRRARTSAPLSGSIALIAARVGATSEARADGTEFEAWIQSPDCPTGTHSIVRLDARGEILLDLDCRTADPTRIALLSGEQKDTIDAPSDDFRANFAISGEGFFALRCGDGSLRLTRYGAFDRDPSGALLDSDGCEVLSSDGDAFSGPPTLNDRGCTVDGRCLAVVRPSANPVNGVHQLKFFSFSLDPLALNDGWLDWSARPVLFSNAFENVRAPAPENVAGIDWNARNRVSLAQLPCD